MAQRDNRLPGRCLGSMQSPDCRRYAPLSGEAKHPAGARPSKCIIISAGVARIQVQVTPRPVEYWQCPKLDGRNSTLASFVALMTCGQCKELQFKRARSEAHGMKDSLEAESHCALQVRPPLSKPRDRRTSRLSLNLEETPTIHAYVEDLEWHGA
jgi:hypothetical protein